MYIHGKIAKSCGSNRSHLHASCSHCSCTSNGGSSSEKKGIVTIQESYVRNRLFLITTGEVRASGLDLVFRL